MNEKTKTAPTGGTEERLERLKRLANENFMGSDGVISVTYVAAQELGISFEEITQKEVQT